MLLKPFESKVPKQRSSGASRRAWNAAKWRHVLFSMVLAVFLCFFHLLVSCHFMFVFLKFWAKFPWHHSFAHVARGYSEMHLFKCLMLVVVSLQWNGIFYPRNLLFFDLDFSHSSYIMLHGATAKWRFLVFFVFSLQRGAPFLMYGMVDSSFINNELCVCMCLNVFSAEYGIWEH